MKEKIFNEKVWVPSLAPFKFKEQVDPKTGKKRYILKGMMLPFNKISRNNVLYNEQSIRDKHKQLVGRPLMYNHQVEGAELPLGHFIDSYCEGDGWYYKADIDPEEKHAIRKLERGDLRHVSIQLIGGKVEEKIDEDQNPYTEAYVTDIIEGSLVPAPGFLDTTAEFAEAFNPKHKEKKETETRLKEDHLEKGIFPMEEFHKGLKYEMESNPELGPIAAARRVLDHIEQEEYYYSNEKEDMNMDTAGDATATKLADDKEGITDARPQYPMAEEESLQLIKELDAMSKI